MSQQHPIVAVTGSAASGTTTVTQAFGDIFRRRGIQSQFVKGDGFYRYNHAELEQHIAQPSKSGHPISYFGPEANYFDKLEKLFQQYGKNGSGEYRHYLRTEDDAKRFKLKVGAFTPWQKVDKGTDLMFYEGMHGGVAAHTWTRRKANPAHLPQGTERRGSGGKGINAAQHVDLLIGVVPAVNLEWIQKIHRDCSRDGCTVEESTATILRRMRDYTHFIAPQFALTDINFQRMPLVDTSHPFIARDIPTAEESIVVIHFRDPHKFDFPSLLQRISGSFMSRPNTLVVPGGKMRLALDVACTPLIEEMLQKKSKKARA